MKPTLPNCLSRQMMTRLVLFSLVFLGLGQMKGISQELFRYSNLTSGSGVVASHIAPASLSRGMPDILQATDCMADQGYGSHGWPTTNVFNVNTFNSNKWYVEFTLSPTMGYGLKVTGLKTRSRRENQTGTANDGPIAMRYGYSTDGGMSWTTVNPGNPQSSNLCASGGVERVWPSWSDTLTSNPIIFRIYGLSGGSARDGDLFLRDIVVNGEVCANNPTISPAPDYFSTCYGATSVDYSYMTEEGDTYSIDYDDPSFMDIAPGTVLPSAPNTISLQIPTNTAPGSYTGTLTVSNTCGFSNEYGFTIEVHALPDVSFTVSPSTICAGDDVTLTFTDNGTTGDYFSIKADLVDDNGTTVGAIDFSSVPSGAMVLYTEGVEFDGDVLGMVSLTNIVVTNETTNCVNDTEDDLMIVVNPLPVVTIAEADASGVENDAAICAGGSATLTASGGVSYHWSNGATDAAISVTPVSTTTYTVTVTSADNCTASASQTITVNPNPDASFSVVPLGSICPGSAIEIYFNESAWMGSPEFSLTADVNPTVFNQSSLSFTNVIDGDHIDLTEGTDFTGDLSGFNIVVTESVSGCSSTASDISVDVYDAPTFGFTAATEGDGPYAGNNTTGPNTVEVDFCAGNHLTLSGYTDNGNIGYTYYFTTSGNVNYDGGAPYPLSDGPNNIAPNTAANFFGMVYGGVQGYGLTSGTSGTINQVFIPYLDNDNSGTLTAGDCIGDSMFLNYHVYAIPTVTATPSAAVVCKGAVVNITFSGNYASGVTYSWTNGTTAIGLGTSGTGDISFTAANPNNTDLVANFTVIPSANGCEGTPVDFTVTVHPMPMVSVTGTTTNGSPQLVTNYADPSTMTLDFCAGESFTFSGYNGTPGIGFIEEIIDGTTNLMAAGSPITVPRPQTNIPFGGAAAFFGGTYGAYTLSSGTYGWLEQVYTPYYDAAGNGVYDPMTDCLGEPFTVIYHVYATPVVTVTRNAAEICSGGNVDYTISTNASQNVLFDITLTENTNGANPADLDDDNLFPIVLTGLSINDLSPYHFTQLINNAVGVFDRGRVSISITNAHYADASVCTATVINANPNTQVYPKPRLAAPVDKLICSGNSSNIDIDLDPSSLPSSNIGNAGYPIRIEWTVVAPGITGAANGNATIYNNVGAEVSAADINQVLSLNIPGNGPQTATYTITPRAAGPTNAANGDDCFGDPITIIVTVVPPAVPVITGPTCVHVGAEIQLTADNDVEAPASFLSGVWSATPNVTLIDTFDLDTVLVTGAIPGASTIYYTVTDDAGCVSTATYQVTVLDAVSIEHVYSGSPVSCGEEFTVSIEVSNFCDINTLDYPFTWDADAFQLVTFTSPYQQAGGTFSSFTSGPGELYLNFYDDGDAPYGNSVPDGTVVMTYTLRAIGTAGSHNIPDAIPASEVYNSNFSVVGVNTIGISPSIQAITLDLGLNPVVCPNDANANLVFSNVHGNPDYYVIDFDAAAEAAGFPDIQEGNLVVMDGHILIPLPNNLQHGSYNAVLVVSNTQYGCVSGEYLFEIIVDQIPPMVPTPMSTSLACISSIPAPDVNVVVGETDNCTADGDLIVAYVPGMSSQSGTGCAGNPLIINRVYSVTDEAGNTTYVTHVITVEDNIPPTISTSGLANWYQSGAAAIAAALARANATKIDINGCTPPVGINVTLGSVDTSGCNGTIVLFVTDACGNLAPTANTTFYVTIDRNKPTVTAGIIDDCYDVDDAPTAPYFDYGYAVQAAIDATMATDDCDMSLTFTAVVSGDKCETVITVTATDDCGKSNSVVYHTRVENTAPIINPYNPLALDGDCFTTEAEAIAAAIAATSAGDDCTAPEELQYDGFASAGCPAQIMVVVTDYCGNPATITYTGVYIDVLDPEVHQDEGYETCYKTEAEALASLAIASNPSDNCSTEAELLASATAVFSGPACDQTVVITFTDHCGRTVTSTFEGIIIDNIAPTVSPLAPLSYVCFDDIDEPNINLVMASDNCGVQDIEWVSDNLPTTCPGTGTRTYRVFDCAGNSTDVVQSISVNDNVAPTWVTTPANNLDRSFYCGDDITPALNLKPVAEDNCGEVTVTLVSDVTGGGCANMNRTRTWSAVDQCGNSATNVFTQVITVIDNVAPTWITVAGALNASIECSDPNGLANAQAMAPVAMDACTGFTMVKTSGMFVGGGFCPQEGTYTNTWVATDACGNTSTAYTQVITIKDDTAPTWITPQGQPFPTGLNLTVSCSDIQGYDFANNLAPVATDLCDASVTLIKSPGTFVPGGDCLGEGSVTNTWIASDDCGNSSTVFTQVITIIDNTPPTFDPMCQFMPLNLFTSSGADCHAGISLSVGDLLNYQSIWTVAGVPILPLGACISDNCSPLASIIAEVVSISDVPGQTVQVNFEYTAECVRQITVSFQLRDDCGNVQPTLFTCVYNIIDDTAPLVFCFQRAENRGGPSLPQDCYETVAEAEAAALEMINPCDNCTDTEDLIITASTVGTCNAAVTVTVADCAGNESSYTFYTRIDNAAPVMVVSAIPTCYVDQAAAQAAAIAATTITDDCDSYGNLVIQVVTTGTCPATVTVTATDQCGHSQSVAYPGLCIGTATSVNITTDASDLNVDCDGWQSDLQAWLGNHGGAIATGSGINWSFTPIDPQTALEMSMPNCTTHTKSVLVTFIATDGCGYSDSSTATFSVTDNTPPTANLIANTNLTCNANIPAPDVNIVTGEMDNCGGTPTVAVFATSDNMESGCPGHTRIIIHQYVVTDAYCNTALINHMITVLDNVPPTFAAPANITINVNAACEYNASSTITGDVTNEMDNCTPSGAGLQAYYTDVVNAGVNMPDKFVITRTWQLVDACGNTAIPRVQTITVQDVTAPTLTGCPSNTTLPGILVGEDCGASASGLSSPAFSDNCSGATLSYMLSGATLGSGVSPISQTILEGVTTVTYKVTDAVGNTATCSFTITVNCLTISGRIIWEHNGSGVKNATVNGANVLPTPAFMGSDLSDTNGNYDISVPAAGTFRITPVKNNGGNAGRMNGVDAADATRITNHVNFSNPITNPYKKVCADVNRSGVINTQDATLITQCIAGNPTAQAVFNVFWRFVPTSFVMPVTAHQNVPVFPAFKDATVAALDVLGVDFYGMKIGDVDTSWANPQLAPTLAPLVWVLQDQVLVAGTEVELSFTTSNFNDLAAYQMALDFDPSQLQFVGFQPLNAISMNLLDNFGSYNADQGELRNVWSVGSGTTLTDGTQVFRAKFKVLKGGQKLSDVIKLDNSEIQCKAYSSALVPLEMKLVFTESVGTDSPYDLNRPQLELMQNHPNPFTDATTIGFILPEACNAQIRILDISGRELTVYDRKYTAGYHELDFRMENAASYGMLFCELVTPQGKRTIKMITTR